MMPYASGFEIISKWTQHLNTEKASIIVISSITREDSVMDSFKIDVDEYIRKPTMIGELLVRVNNSQKEVNVKYNSLDDYIRLGMLTEVNLKDRYFSLD